MPPVSEAQRKWAWANKDKDTQEGHAAKEFAQADPGGKLPKKAKGSYDRSAHHKGNPGFPSSSEAGGSPPPKSFQAHEQRERDLLGAGYNLHEKAEQSSYLHGKGKLLMSPPSNAQTFSGTHRSGPLRLSGHKGAHQIGKRR